MTSYNSNFSIGITLFISLLSLTAAQANPLAPAAGIVLPFPGGYYLPDAPVLEPGKFRMETFATDLKVIMAHHGKGGAKKTVPLSREEDEKFTKQFECYQLCAHYLNIYQSYSSIGYADVGAVGPDGSVYLMGNSALTKIPFNHPEQRIALLPERITGYAQSDTDDTVEPVYAYAGNTPVVTAQGKIFILGEHDLAQRPIVTAQGEMIIPAEHELDQVVGGGAIKKIPLPLDQGNPQDFPPMGVSDLSISPAGCILVPTKGKPICVDANGQPIADYGRLPYSKAVAEQNALATRIPGSDIAYKNNSYAAGEVVSAPKGEYFYALMSQIKVNGKAYTIDEVYKLPVSLYRFRVEKHECDPETNNCKFTISKPDMLARGNGTFLSSSKDLRQPDYSFKRIVVARNGDVYLIASYTIYKLTPDHPRQPSNSGGSKK